MTTTVTAARCTGREALRDSRVQEVENHTLLQHCWRCSPDFQRLQTEHGAEGHVALAVLGERAGRGAVERAQAVHHALCEREPQAGLLHVADVGQLGGAQADAA